MMRSEFGTRPCNLKKETEVAENDVQSQGFYEAVVLWLQKNAIHQAL